MSTELSADSAQQTIVFKLGEECYGVDIFRVNEIIRLREITPIPRTEDHIKGLVNLRGKTIPVVDLKIRLGLGSYEPSPSTRIIVLDSDDGHVGIIVDAVREVLTLESDSIENPSSVVTELDAEFLLGVAKHASGLISILDLDRALAA